MVLKEYAFGFLYYAADNMMVKNRSSFYNCKASAKYSLKRRENWFACLKLLPMGFGRDKKWTSAGDTAFENFFFVTVVAQPVFSSVSLGSKVQV